MKRRSSASSEQGRSRRPKSSKSESRNPPKVASSRPSPTGAETDVQLRRELHEALEQQAATSEVLRVISSSPRELPTVFQTILANATRLCEANFGILSLFEGDMLRVVAMQNVPPAYAEHRRREPLFRPPPWTSDHKDAFHVTNCVEQAAYKEGDPSAVAFVELGGVRTLLAEVMKKEGRAVGLIAIYRQEVRPFTEKQIALLQHFATQAVIAVENARLLNELRQRTTDLSQRTIDLTEALEQQTATSVVLQVISSSPGDLEPVFSSMLENAVRICDATFGNIYRWDGETLRLVASHNVPPAYAEARRRLPLISPGTQGQIHSMIANKRAVHVLDVAADPAYTDERNPSAVAAVELGGVRTFLAVPMLRERDLIGAFIVSRQEVRPFTDKQIALVTNFAAQAVIAIENARLLNDLRQRTTDLSVSLERQTATSEILSVISSSRGEIKPVLDTILANATRLCEASFGTLILRHEEEFRLAAAHNVPRAYAEIRQRDPVIRSGPLARIVATKQPFQTNDCVEDPAYKENDPDFRVFVDKAGARSAIGIPMLKGQELIGTINIFRQEVRPFTDAQIALVQGFAAQAVIAIENARLLNELEQSLEQQTATSEVLSVVSSSLGDLQPVFAKMVENAVRICHANWGHIHQWDGETLHLVASHNTPPAFAAFRSSLPHYRPHPKALFGQLAATQTVTQIIDSAAVEAYTARLDPIHVAAVELGGARTTLGVPMLKEDQLIGAFALVRQEVQPFTDKQIALVKNFAAQAVIAIENARLLKELHERTSQLEAQSQEVVKLNQQLEQRVADQVGEIERMGRLRRFLPPQVADLIVASGTEKQLESHRREITALFCDLRGFTGFSEASAPEDVMALLRDYHAAIGEIIIKYSGTLERYAGDGVMVVFNDPVPVEKPAVQAVLMALEAREAMGALTEKWRQLGHHIGFGIGIAHGYATLGTIGFEGRFDYAAIGTVSNVASRLCDEAKPGQILISPRVFMAVKDAVIVEPVGEFTLKGIGRPLPAYNVLAAK